jgi:hypothetical protein
MAAGFYSGTFVFTALCFYLFIRASFRKPLPSLREVCREDVPELYVWAPVVFVGDAGGGGGRASFAGHLHRPVDLLGDDDYEEHSCVKRK